MYSLYIKSLKDFRSAHKKYFFLESVYGLITSFILIPAFALVFNRIFRAADSGFLVNNDVYKVAFSYKGLTGIALLCFLSVLVLFVEFGILVVISQKKYFHKEVMVSEAFLTVLRKTPRLFGIGLLQFMVLLLLLVPFIDFPLLSSFLESMNIPVFIQSKIDGSSLLMALYAAVFLCVVYILLRWIFSLHYIIIEGKSTTEAIRCSVALTKRKRMRTLLHLFLLNIIFIASGLLLTSSVTILPSLFGVNVKGHLLENYMILLSSCITLAAVLFVMPLNTIFITRLFYHFKREQGMEIQDTLTICRNGILRSLEEKVFAFFRRRKSLTLCILTVYLAGIFWLNYSLNHELINLRWNILVIGHRGDVNSAPENSLSGIRSAVDKGVNAVEMDVQLTKDGVVVLNHDLDLKRVAGVSRNVWSLTYDEISRIDIGQKYPELFHGERIPTLEEALAEIRGKALAIIEIKAYSRVKELTEKVVEIIERYEMTEDCYIQSFDVGILRTVRERNSDIKIGQILYMAAGDLSALDVDFYTIERSMLSDKLIQKAHDDHRQVWVWTINSERSIREVLKYDIDGIITDYPERVRKIIEAVSD